MMLDSEAVHDFHPPHSTVRDFVSAFSMPVIIISRVAFNGASSGDEQVECEGALGCGTLSSFLRICVDRCLTTRCH